MSQISDLQLLNEYKKAVDAGNIVSKTDKSGRIIYVNDKFCEISGYKREELIGKPHNIVRHPDMSSKTFAELWDTIKSKNTWNGIVKNLKKDGGIYYVDSTIIPILDEKGEVVEYIAIRKEITELIESREKIKEQNTDQLTGLYNRIKLSSDIEDSKEPALALINIDRFKSINDFYGFKIGDQVLRGISKFLIDHIDVSRLHLYRIAGDEFALLDENCKDFERFQKIAKELQKKLDNYIFFIDWYEIEISTSIGVAKSKKDLYFHADIALSTAKKSKEKFEAYDSSLEKFQQYHENVKWAKRLKDALAEDRIVPFFQPLYNYKTNRVDKFECLVRLSENGEFISPFFFLDVAKQTKQYDRLSQDMLTKSFEKLEKTDYSFSVNISAEDIENAQTVSLLKSLISRIENKERIILEITESSAIESFEKASLFIKEMQEIGCRIAIDDFGSGYANFNYLIKLNPDIIKIDGSIIKMILEDKDSRLIADLIVDYSHKTGKEVVAEFVSDRVIFDAIKEMGIDYAQGFFVGKPEQITDDSFRLN